jgi:hypothetical protein
MVDTTTRVQQWRQRLREEGKVPLTVYVGHAEKLRLEDLAATWHCSVSDLVQQAVAAYHPGSPASPGQAASLAQVRELIREELRSALERPTPEDAVPATRRNVAVLDTPHSPVHPDTPALRACGHAWERWNPKGRVCKACEAAKAKAKRAAAKAQRQAAPVGEDTL